MFVSNKINEQYEITALAESGCSLGRFRWIPTSETNYHLRLLCERIPQNHEAVRHVILKPDYSCGVFAVVTLRQRLNDFEGDGSIGLLVGNKVSDRRLIVLVEHMLEVFEWNEESSFWVVDGLSFLWVTMKIEGNLIWFWEVVTDCNKLSCKEEHGNSSNNVSQVHSWSVDL